MRAISSITVRAYVAGGLWCRPLKELRLRVQWSSAVLSVYENGGMAICRRR